MTQPTDAPRGFVPRWIPLAITAIFVIGVIVSVCGDLFIDVIVNDAIDGAVLLAWIIAGFGYGSLVLLVGWALPAFGRNGGQHPPYDPLLKSISTIALGLGCIGLIVLGLGLAALLSQVTAIAIVVIGLAAALYTARQASFATIKSWLAARTSPAALLLVAPLAVVIIAASLSPGFLWKPLDPHPYDVLSYHLQIPREWYDAHRIIPLRHNSFSFFPMGMEMHDLLAMHLLGGPWKAMYLCQFMSVAFGTLTVIGVVGAVRSLGGSSTIAWLAGLATACIPWTTMLSSVAYVEPGVMCYTLLAVVWAAMGMKAKGEEEKRQEKDAENIPTFSPLTPSASRLAPFLLACAFAAFACGMKYTAFPMTAAPVILLYPFFAGKRSIKMWLLGGVLCVVLVSPWMIRNLFWAHNPVFPLASNIFGHAHFTADQVERYLTAHAPPVAERSIFMRLLNGWHRIALDPQFGYLLLPMTLIAMVLSWRSLRLRYITFVTIAMSLVWLLATHDMPRFLTPAIPLAAVIIGGVAARQPLGRWVVGGLFLIQSVIGLGWTGVTLEPFLDLGRQGAFRMADLSIIETDETKAARTSGDKVALIGDAQAFFYVMPSDKLLYRGVFDVHIPPGVDTVDGWLGKSVDALRHEGYWVVINTSELNRLSKTYAHIPKPKPPYDQVSAAPIVLPPIR